MSWDRARGARVIIASDRDGACGLCGAPYTAGRVVAWHRRSGAVCIACGVTEAAKTACARPRISVSHTRPGNPSKLNMGRSTGAPDNGANRGRS